MTDTRIGIVLVTTFLAGFLVWANIAAFPASLLATVAFIAMDLAAVFFISAGSYIQWMLDKNRDEDCGCGD